MIMITRELTALQHDLEVAKKDAQKQKQRAEIMEQFVDQMNQKEGSNTLVDELRQSNQQLVNRIAELKANQHQVDGSKEKERVEILEKEVDALRKAQEEQERVTIAISKQRDMYKILLTEKDAALLEKDKPEKVLQATHAQLVLQAKEATLQLATVRTTLQKKVDALQRQLIEKAAEMDHAKQATEVERKCVSQVREALKHQQNLVATLEAKAKQMEQEASHLQQLLAAKQNEVDKEREKVGIQCITEFQTITLSGSQAALKQQVERLTASQTALQESRNAWQNERKRLSDLLEEVQRGSQAIQQRHESELTVLRGELKKAQAAQQEATDRLDKACVVHLGRLQEVCANVYDDEKAFEKERSLSDQLKQTQTELHEVRSELASRYVMGVEIRNRDRNSEEQKIHQIQSEKVVQSLEARVSAQLASLARSNTQSLIVSLDELRQVERQLAKQTAELKATRAELEESSRRSVESQQAATAMETEFQRYKTEKEAEISALREQLQKAEKIQIKLESLTTNPESKIPAGNREAELEAKLTANEKKLILAQHENEELQHSLEAQREAFETLEANYRQEFQKHSEDLQNWRTKEKSIQLMRSELATAQEALERKEKELNALKVGETTQEEVSVKRVNDIKTTKADVNELKERVATLTQQNEALFNQIKEVIVNSMNEMQWTRGGDTSPTEIDSSAVLAVSLRRECEIARSARALAETQAAEAEREKAEAIAARITAEKQLEEMTEKLAGLEAAGSVAELMKREAEARQLLQVYAESNNTLRAQTEKQAEDLVKTEELVEELEKQAKEKESIHALAHSQLELLEKKMNEYEKEKEKMQQQIKEATEKVKRSSVQIMELQKKNKQLEVEQEKMLANQKSQATKILPSTSLPATAKTVHLQVTQPQTPKSLQSAQQTQIPKPSQPSQNSAQSSSQSQIPVQSSQTSTLTQPSKSVQQTSTQTSQAVQSPKSVQATLQSSKPIQSQPPRPVPTTQSPVPPTQSQQTQNRPTPKLSAEAPQFAPARLFQGVLQAASGETESLKRPTAEQQQSVGGETKKPHIATEGAAKKEEDVLRNRVERFQ